MTDRDKRLEELRRKVNDTMTYRKMFRLHGSDEMCLDVLWLIEEIERLQQREQTELSTAFWAREGLIEKLQLEVSQLKEERDDFKHGHIMQQAEIKGLREALRDIAINSACQPSRKRAARALGIGEES